MGGWVGGVWVVGWVGGVWLCGVVFSVCVETALTLMPDFKIPCFIPEFSVTQLLFSITKNVFDKT